MNASPSITDARGTALQQRAATKRGHFRPIDALGAEGDLLVAEHLTRIVGPQRSNVTILDDVSFSVPRLSLFAINGPSGSGKTTLLNLLTGIDRPNSGQVLFEGRPLAGRSENALARWRGKHVGIVFQFFHLVPTLTAYENVLLALELGGGFRRSEWRTRATECLASVGIESYARRMPSELSGGEQQRVAIARALANDPRSLSPTSRRATSTRRRRQTCSGSSRG